MKKKWMGVLLALLALLNGIPVGAVMPPEACPVPEAVLHEAVLSIGRTQIGEDSEGEFLCEGHIVLGSEETEDTVDVYAVIRYIDYGFMAGIFTDSGGGCGMIPVKMTFAKPAYTFVSVQWPEDGENHYRSIAQMLPDELEDAWADEGVPPALDAQIIAQAEAYVKSLGRTEKVMDWRLLDPPLDVARMLVAASNTLGRLYPYPLWVTEREDVEDGVRYRYERIWQPDGVCGGVIYTVNGKQADCMDGDTGVEILRRTRLTDGAVLEEITARVALDGLTVTVAHPEGSRTYTLRYDGRQYTREKIEDTGDYRMDAYYLKLFDDDVMRMPEWAPNQKSITVSLLPVQP